MKASDGSDGEAQLFKALFKFRTVVRRGPRGENGRIGENGERGDWAVEEAKQAGETSSGEYDLRA